MPWKSRTQSAAHREFVVHIPTGRVGRVIRVSMMNVEGNKTVRLAGGELASAPAHEFRPATGSEIERHHRTTASIRPLVLPVLPTTQSPTAWNRPGHRIEL